MIVKHLNFDQLIDNVYQTHCQLQLNAKKVVNINLTILNWLVGYHIVKFEQNGEDRAKYGINLIGELASKLKTKGLKGFSVSALKNHRTFYLLYPQISQSVISFLGKEKSQSVTGELQKQLPIPIRRSLTTELQEYPISSETLLSQLSFTHFIELIKFDDSLERLFYEVETIKNNWSVRELERAINTALYVRTGLSKNKEAVIAKFKNQKPAQNIDVIRDPYFLEFLGLEERSEYSESELEQAILDHLQKFLIEWAPDSVMKPAKNESRLTIPITASHYSS
ncbi:MAG: hypothetical protein BGO34_16680 [Bacteroidia bacterium 44-10]|nr:MAG: hypothetical protein BGO34_16680 [Bacteroidia bacterium 44-10]